MNSELIFYFLLCIVGNFVPTIADGKTMVDMKNKFKIPVVLPNFSQFLPINFCRAGRHMFRSYVACNGRIDCPDKSDETLKLCQHTKCGSSLFRCDYGACVGRHLVCDGVFDCADGSDESLHLCKSAQCRVPFATSNTVYYITDCEGECGGIPAEDGTTLHYVCANNSSDTNLSLMKATCRNGFWQPIIPSCTRANKVSQDSKPLLNAGGTPTGDDACSNGEISSGGGCANKPSGEADKPTGNADKPPASADKPPANADKPPASVDKPPASADKPPASADKPPASADKPPASADKPPASADTPQASADKPPASVDKPPNTRKRK